MNMTRTSTGEMFWHWQPSGWICLHIDGKSAFEDCYLERVKMAKKSSKKKSKKGKKEYKGFKSEKVFKEAK